MHNVCNLNESVKLDVFSTVHHSIELFYLPTSMHNSLFIKNMYLTCTNLCSCFKLYYSSRLNAEHITETQTYAAT